MLALFRHPGESRDPDFPREDCESIEFDSLGPGFRRDDGSSIQPTEYSP